MQIVDIAPTVLRLLGIARPRRWKGDRSTSTRAPRRTTARVKTLVKANRAAVFRDTTIGKATAALVVLTLLLAAGGS